MNREVEKILFDYLETQKADRSKEDIIQDLTKSINSFYNQQEIQRNRKIASIRSDLARVMLDYIEEILDTEFSAQEKEEMRISIIDTLKKSEPAITNIKAAMNDNDLIKSYIKSVMI